MTLYKCDCGFGSIHGATAESITQHLYGVHDKEVNVASTGYFSSATPARGEEADGRRFDSFENLLEHLELS